MTPYEVYRDYLALRSHFNNAEYDYFKYKGKASGSVASFNKRKDKIFFERLAKHRDPHGVILAAFVKNPKAWIRDIAYSEEYEQYYNDRNKKLQSLSYHIKNDLAKIDESFDDALRVTDNQHPTLMRLHSAGVICDETLCIIVDLTGCYKHWNAKLSGDVVWDQISLFIRKYTPFIPYDKDKIKKIVVDTFQK